MSFAWIGMPRGYPQSSFPKDENLPESPRPPAPEPLRCRGYWPGLGKVQHSLSILTRAFDEPPSCRSLLRRSDQRQTFFREYQCEKLCWFRGTRIPADLMRAAGLLIK